MHNIGRKIITAFALAAGLAPLQAGAQTIYKCVIDGKTVYQSEACPKAGKLVKLEPGPTAAEVEEATRRGERDKGRASAAMAVAAARQASAASAAAERPRTGPGADCAALNRAYSEAWGRRNAYVRSRAVNATEGLADRTLNDVETAERNVKSAGCKLE